ncbi:hypothetical protein [Ottowia sp. VDI28]|uniref:hypothetical protein n=1 Tax=Ottowia sp. VDI28 TaxID=3133968 RepID=UPI003C2B6C1D
MTKCPRCEQDITQIDMKEITGTASGPKHWKCIAYTCPHCSTLISVQMNPLALKNDILSGVQALLAAQPIRY